MNLFDRQTETFRAFRTSDGLSNDVVQSIGEDDQGHFWLGIKGGLSKFDPRTETVTNYDKSDGLLAETFKHNATLRSRGGELFFGGANGFTSFHPDSVRDNPHRPPIVLTDVQLFNKPVAIGERDSPLQKHITEADRIQLRYDQVGGLMGAYSRRVQAFEKRQHELEIQVADRTKALNEANEGLNATNETVEKTNQQLEAKNDELERFAYTVSHDLKSPLVTIRGFLGLLNKDIATGDQQRMQRDFAQIINATDKMQRLLDELLRLSRVGRLAHVSETVSLGDLADEAVALVSGHIAERGVEVTILPDLPVVLGDRVRLTEVFQNLIANAVKYMGDQTNPRIEIGSRPDEAEVVCFVRDNGMGIDPRYHEKVFGLFERLDASNEGTGIGLALVKRIIEVHGGVSG